MNCVQLIVIFICFFAGSAAQAQLAPSQIYSENLNESKVVPAPKDYVAILQEKISKEFDSINQLAQYMLAHFPYSSVEVGQIGQSKISAGFVYRVKREVQKNLNSRSQDDAYLIKDSIEFQINIGLSVEYDKKILNAYGSLAPGYIKNFILIRPVSSLEEAKKSYWSISKDILLNANYHKIKTNEIMAVEYGYCGSLIVGAGLLSVIPKTKPQGYVMDSLKKLEMFQVARPEEGRLLITTSNDNRNDISGKAFIKVLSKLIRIPFASINHQIGGGVQNVYEFNALSDGTWNSETLQKLTAILKNTDMLQLANEFKANKLNTDYSWLKWFINFYYFEVHGETNRISIENAENTPNKQYYTLVSSRNISKIRSSSYSEIEECSVAGILAQQNFKMLKAEDAGITFKCEFEANGLSPNYMIRDKIDVLTTMFKLSEEDVFKLKAIVLSSPFHVKIHILAIIPKEDLINLVNVDVNTHQQLKMILDSYGSWQDLPLSGHSLLSRKLNYFNIQLFQILKSEKSIDRMTKMTEFLSDLHNGADFKKVFFSRTSHLKF